MGGHSHWSTIKRQKGASDISAAPSSRSFRAVTVAAREGGGDPRDEPAAPRLAVEKAREGNMPMDTIKRAIERGAGAGDGGPALEEITFGGYGPGGVAILVQTLTDNRNRTVSDLRTTLNRERRELGESGSVAWQFDKQRPHHAGGPWERPEELALQAIDAGAEDVLVDGNLIESTRHQRNWTRSGGNCWTPVTRSRWPSFPCCRRTPWHWTSTPPCRL